MNEKPLSLMASAGSGPRGGRFLQTAAELGCTLAMPRFPVCVGRAELTGTVQQEQNAMVFAQGNYLRLYSQADGGDPLTIGLWAKASKTPAGTAVAHYHAIFSIGMDSADPSAGMNVQVEENGMLSVRLPSYRAFLTDRNVEGWHHIAVVLCNAAPWVKLYVDGEPVSSADWVDRAVANRQVVHLHRSPWGTSAGTLPCRNVFIARRELSQTEIRAMRNKA